MSHPILDATEVIGATLKGVTDANPVFMTSDEKASALEALGALEARLVELRLRVMAVAGDVAAGVGARDVGCWYADKTRGRLADARREARLAEALDARLPVLGKGLRDGAVNLDQAHVIAAALDRLPADLDPGLVTKAEAHLVEQAAVFGPRHLARIGRKILDVLAPDIADAEEEKRLRDLENNAAAQSRLTMRRLGDGTTRVSARISDAAANRLMAYLHAFTNPRTRSGTESDAADAADAKSAEDLYRSLPHPRKLGRAFTQLLEVMDTARLPIHGGSATTILITIPLADLQKDLATGDVLTTTSIPGDVDDITGTVETLTAGQVRRLACTANLTPVVLGADSEILDLGRTRRLHSVPQRNAMALRDRTCVAEGCDIPATWCEAHHWTPWSHGGHTTLHDGSLLCSRHHHCVHDPDYTVTRLAGGRVRFTRRS